MRHVNTPQGQCRLGVARCDITPPIGIYHRMWGAATHERATGVHRPLTATALVFQAHDLPLGTETEQVLIAVDHCLLWAREMDTLLTALEARTGLAREQISIAFSHTHASGLMDLNRVHLPGGDLIPPYLDRLADRLSQIIIQARASVRPATLTYTKGRCPLAAQRDFWDEVSGQIVCGLNPEGPTDDTVMIARATDFEGKLIATVVNYACHPTTLAWENTLISPDYPGAMREVVEEATGAPCVFLQGASGDLGPREGFVGDPAIADRNGRELGYAVLTALEGLPPPLTRFDYKGPVVSGATLGAWQHVPLDEESRRKKARWWMRRRVIDLPYRPEIPTLEQTRTERENWLEKERAFLATGDTARARDCRAQVERQDRWLTRLATLPPGKTFPLPVTLWQVGDGFWLMLEGEFYHALQRELRERFPDLPLMVATVVNGARPTYLPTREAYGKGIYQESIAVLEKGCLEQLIQAIGSELQSRQKHLIH